MRPYPIFCPVCDELILDASACPSGHWSRPSDTAEVGQFVGEALTLPVKPHAKAPLIAAGNQIWLTGLREGNGALLALHWATQTVRTYPLAAGQIAAELSGIAETILASMNDAGMPTRSKRVLALNAATGEPRWQQTVPSAFALSTPTPDGNAVFALSDAGDLYTLAMADGTPQRPPIRTDGDVRHAPVLHSGLALVSGTSIGPTAPLIAVDLALEQIKWRAAGDEPLVAPVVVADRTVCTASLKLLIGLDIQTGKSAWLAPYQPPRETSHGAITTPLAGNGACVFFGGGDLINGQPGYALYAVDVKTGRKAWAYHTARHLTLAPVVVGSLVVCIDHGGHIAALNAASGELVWQAQLPAAPLAPPLAFDDFLLLVDKFGQLHTLRYRSAAARPTLPPEAYAARQDWNLAAVAHALRGDLSQSGHYLLQAGDARHALKIFERNRDQAGRAQALTALHEWDSAIQIYRNQNAPTQVAEVLAKADRHAEAAAQFEALGDLVRAGHEYQHGGRLIEAANCFLKSEQIEALTALSVSSQADRTLAARLAETDHWQLAVNLYARLKALEEAARLCEARGDKRQAIKWWRQIGNWQRSRALAQELNDKQLEVDICLQQKQYGEAARLLEELGQWAAALPHYETVRNMDGQLRVLAALGRYVVAAERAAAAQRFVEAGQYYQKAAGQAASTQADNPAAAADFWRKAADQFALSGSKDEGLTCLRQAAQALGEPILELAAINLDDLLVNHAARLSVTIKNVGYGPARQLQVWLDGSDFGFQGYKSVIKPITALAAGDEHRLQVGLKPVTPGQPELQLKVSYLTHKNVETSIEFQSFLSVRNPDDTKPSMIHIDKFEYVGQGGIRAQDSVVIQRGTDLARAVNLADNAPPVIEDGTTRLIETVSQSCPNCGWTFYEPLEVCRRCKTELTIRPNS